MEAQGPRTPFVGRLAELDELEGWVDRGGGLITLTGPPGMGKTLNHSLMLRLEYSASAAELTNQPAQIIEIHTESIGFRTYVFLPL